MEEILASIRRIIADDDVFPGARRRSKDLVESASDAAPVATPAETIETPGAYPEPALELRAASVATAAAAADAWDDRELEARPTLAPADVRPLRLARPQPEPVALDAEAGIVDDDGYGDAPQGADLEAYGDALETESMGFAVDSEGPLVSTDAASSIAAQFQTLAASMILNDSGLLQKYAQEMMRPMLKQWLDDNLPVIVERLVRAEIERVARGGRR